MAESAHFLWANAKGNRNQCDSWQREIAYFEVHLFILKFSFIFFLILKIFFLQIMKGLSVAVT